MMTVSTKSTVTAAEHFAIGAFGGVSEVCLMQPMVGIKNALQEGRPIPTYPLHLYRGLVVSSVMPVCRRGRLIASPLANHWTLL